MAASGGGRIYMSCCGWWWGVCVLCSILDCSVYGLKWTVEISRSAGIHELMVMGPVQWSSPTWWKMNVLGRGVGRGEEWCLKQIFATKLTADIEPTMRVSVDGVGFQTVHEIVKTDCALVLWVWRFLDLWSIIDSSEVSLISFTFCTQNWYSIQRMIKFVTSYTYGQNKTCKGRSIQMLYCRNRFIA